MTPVFAYARMPLVAAGRLPALEERFSEVAALYGTNLDGRVFYERGCPAQVLWSLINSAGVAGQVVHASRQRGVSIEKLLGAGVQTAALWNLIDALRAVEGGYVLVPSPRHLELPNSRKDAVLQVISSIGASQIVWIGDEPDKPPVDLPGSAAGQIVEFRVSALGAATSIARATIDQRLGRAGLRHMIDAVDAVIVEVVGAAERRWAASIDTLTEELSVRVMCPPGRAVLVMEVHEAREFSDAQVSDGLQRICDSLPGGKAARLRGPMGGTLTRCEFALPPTGGDSGDVPTDSTLALADALLRFHQTASEIGEAR